MSRLPQGNPLNLDDEKFYKTVQSEISSFEAIIKPQMHSILHLREKVNRLRATLASTCVPELIEFKDNAEQELPSNLVESVEKIGKDIEALEKRCRNHK